MSLPGRASVAGFALQ